ncbi:MAG: low molecular weight phosphotyrosine protein phosphatase [Clostridia bacterium]|nr:low molecular weight phosphotyrosine protein phosphatase [Clostridia bacterium]
MNRIMFVCLGNICRSPMAEIIFRDMAEKAGRSGEFLIASSATSDENVRNGTGAEVYPPAKKILAKHGLSAGGKRAVQLTAEDGGRYDMFVCMDRYNVRNVSRILGEENSGKIRMLMDFTGRPGDVSDPWYTGDFKTAYRDIYEGCKGLLGYFENETADSV